MKTEVIVTVEHYRYMRYSVGYTIHVFSLCSSIN